jgi:uncharacterized protein YndB with AHSA1/START domain
MFRVTMELRDLGDKTELDMTMALETAEAAQQARVFVKAASGNSTWDRLGEHLEKEQTSKEIFVINRSFEASIDTMFDAWTKPEQFSQWLPPTGFTMQFKRVDIRTGGESFYAMTNGQFTMYGKAKYLEVRRPDCLRYTQVFVDEHENISRHPMAPTWPETMLTHVTLTAETPTQTRVTIKWEVVGGATDEEMATFIGGRTGMTMGWTGSFDKLEAYLAQLG